VEYKSGKIELIEGDVTRQKLDAIVNAANTDLAPGGGVCGAIHAAAGPMLAQECFTLGGANTGEAKITKGYDLPAEWVIHTPGPQWRGGDHGERELLASSYRHSLELAGEKNLRTIAFPSISTGIFGFPIDEAAPIAIEVAKEFLEENPDFELVRFVLKGEKDYNLFVDTLKDIKK